MAIETSERKIYIGTPEGKKEILQIVPLAELRFGKWYRILRNTRPDEMDTLRKSIAERGVLQPLIITKSMRIVDGHMRCHIARELGLESLPCRKESFDSSEEIEELVLTLQLGRRNLTSSERDELIGRLYQLKKQRRGGDRRSDQRARVAHGSPGNTAEVLASEHGISPRTVKNAAGRVSFTDRHPQFRNDSTKDVLELRKYLQRLQRRERESLLNWAYIKELNSKEVLLAARLMAECNEDAREAVDAVCDGTALSLLNKLNSDTSGQMTSRRLVVSDKNETGLKELLEGLVGIIKRGGALGYDMEEFPWAEMRMLVRKFKKGSGNNIKLVKDSKEEEHERCD